MKSSLTLFIIAILSLPALAQTYENGSFQRQDQCVKFQHDSIGLEFDGSTLTIIKGANRNQAPVDSLIQTAEDSYYIQTANGVYLIDCELLRICPPLFTVTFAEQVIGCEKSLVGYKECAECPKYQIYADTQADLVFCVVKTNQGFKRLFFSAGTLMTGYVNR